MPAHFDPELAEQRLGQRAYSHSGRGLSRTRPLQDITCVVEVVFNSAREIGMARARARQGFLLVLSPFGIFDRQCSRPVLPVFVADDDPYGRSDGFWVA